MASEDGLVGFFLYSLILYPAVNWLLTRYRKGNRGIYLAIAFLAFVASIKTYFEIEARGPNFYQILGVDRGSNPLEVKRAYKRMSLDLHPDKNSSPNAVEEFNRLKEAYDVIINSEARQVYNRFGEEAAKSNRVIDEYHLLLEIAVFYLTWGMLVFVLTLGKSSGEARNWTYTGMIIMLVIELSLKTQEATFPEWFLPRVTEHEMVWLLHTLFPAFMNGCRCIGSFVYKDLTAEMYKKIQNLEQMNAVMNEMLKDLSRNANSGTGAFGRSSIRSPSAGESQESSGPSPIAATLNAQMQAMNAQKSSSSNYGLLIMIVGYIALYHFFQS